MRGFLAVHMTEKVIALLEGTQADEPGGHVPAAIFHGQHMDVVYGGQQRRGKEPPCRRAGSRVRHGQEKVERYGEAPEQAQEFRG